MRKMRDTGVEWIGEVPEGWEIGRIRSLFREVSERYDAQSNNQLPLLSVSEYYGVAKREDKIKTGEVLVRAESLDGYKVCRAGDIVSNIMLAWTGALGVSPLSGIVSPAYSVYRPLKDVCSKYFHYLFRTDRYTDVFNKYSTGIIASRLRLYSPEFYAIPAIIPPLPEQRRIADYLDEKCAAIDGAVCELKRGIEDCKAWKKAIIFEAVTGKRRVGIFNAEKQSCREAEKMRPSGIPWIGEIPEGWRVMRLKHLIGILPGYAFKSEDFNFSNGIRLLRGINVGVDSLRWDECVYWDRVISEDLDRYQIQAGDLIVGLDRPWIEEGTRVCFAKKEDLPCLLVQRVCRIRTLGEMDLRIINYWLSSEAFERALACDTTGVSVPHISPYQIMEFRITLPSLPEQRAIADYLDKKCAAIDAMVVEKEALIADLEAYKKSLIYETVTGKREVA